DKYKISFHITDLGTNNFLAIDNSGNVGRGTASPQKDLHIESGVPTIRMSDDNAATDQTVATLIEFYRGNNTNRVGFLGMESSGNNNLRLSTDYTAGQITLGTGSNATALTIDSNQKVGIGTPSPNEGLTLEGGVLSILETATPTATTNYGKLYTKNNNELFFQDGAGVEHLVHGDSFSNIWFHGTSTTEVAISTEDALTKIDSFTVVGKEDDLVNVVGSISTNDLTLSSIAGGEYEISFHASITATGGADKEMMLALGITLATAKDITDVTDNTISPIVITFPTAHDLENGDMIEIAGVLGNTAANGSFIIFNKAGNTLELSALDGAATVGNGDFDEGSPTGDVTIQYPGNMIVHREVRGTTLGAVSATGVHTLSNSDVLAVYVANLDNTTNLTIAAISFDAFRIGD
ncbi:hypothetical protein LCGC14_2513550, partial [marine sediment metagenome]